MKQLSQSIINATKSILGRWTKVTAVGCTLALVCLVATSAQPQASKQARPFKATAIYTQAGYNFQATGNATHLGKFVGKGSFYVTSAGKLWVDATWTAANGDTINLEFPDWIIDSATFSHGEGNIIGGTGRFANASGEFSATIDSTPGVPMILTADGTISY
jgi:hypothetical protein